MKVKIVIELTLEEAQELSSNLYEDNYECQKDTPLGKLYDKLREAI